MKLLQDGVIAMLAAIGLATILWVLVSIFLRVKQRENPHVTAVVSARGLGSDLEHTVHELEQLRYERGGFGGIVIVDCGLAPEGRELARYLTGEEENVTLCRREELADYFQ